VAQEPILLLDAALVAAKRVRRGSTYELRMAWRLMLNSVSARASTVTFSPKTPSLSKEMRESDTYQASLREEAVCSGRLRACQKGGKRSRKR